VAVRARSSRGAVGVGLSAGRREGRGVPRARVAEFQRSRLLAATVAAIQEVGYERMTVTRIAGRAGVSRRTFYELFASREECVAGVLQGAAGELQSELEAIDLPGLAWRERMRLGLWTILCFLDREPVLARVALVDTQAGSGPVLTAREAIVRGLVGLVDEGRHEKTGMACTELTAEGVLGAIVAILYQSLVRHDQAQHDQAQDERRREPLAALFPELLGIVLLPYLGHAATRREQARPTPPLPLPRTGPNTQIPVLLGKDPLAGLQMRVTYRTAKVLEGVREHAGISNRQIADYAGISDQGQASKLLTRLERLGLLHNTGAGHTKGEPNAWRLTTKGQHVTNSIRAHAPQTQKAA
jgi:AcrR family transcriptional regulator